MRHNAHRRRTTRRQIRPANEYEAKFSAQGNLEGVG
jgi:hypothetical protein